MMFVSIGSPSEVLSVPFLARHGGITVLDAVHLAWRIISSELPGPQRTLRVHMPPRTLAQLLHSSQLHVSHLYSVCLSKSWSHNVQSLDFFVEVRFHSLQAFGVKMP